jgi:crotonobetainyl-CoA:carnitine CoA-transferase CaiB-like acyl-CoA transferase
LRALDDLRVLDLSGHVAGPYCAKMFADFGADVVKVEPPGGESGRRLPPFVGDIPGPDRSAFFLFLNTNKRSVTLDIATPSGAEVLRQLVRSADLVIESFAPGTLESIGLGYEDLDRLRPGIIVTSITPFGQTGPWRDFPISDLVAYACSGWASINGWPDREPLKASGSQASMQAGILAFVASMNAVVHRDRTREGQQVDVSILEPLLATFAPNILAAQYEGTARGRRAPNFQNGPVPTKDGYFALTLSRAHFWRDAMNELGLTELAYDERFYSTKSRRDHAAEVAPLVEARLAEREKRELFEALGALRVVGGMVLTTQEIFEDPHVKERGFLVETEHPVAGGLTYPGPPFKMSGTPWELERPAPRLGEHTSPVLMEAGFNQAQLTSLAAAGVI